MAFVVPEIWDELSGDDNERDRAERDARAAIDRERGTWSGVGQYLPTAEEQQLVYGEDVKPYGIDDPNFDPTLQQYIFRGPSEWADETSAFDTVGPSRFDTMGPSAYADIGDSAFADAGPSAYADLAFDEGRMGEAEDYFSDLTTTGSDPIAEADLAKRVGEAEQRRKANTDAALAAAETRGMAGQGVLAALENAQGSASDQYQAGLDAAAMAAERRDFAGKTVADISERRGRGKLDADSLRAQGLDEHEIARLEALDAWEMDQAAGLDEFGLERAAGGDRFAGETATGKDRFTGYKTDALESFNNKEYQRLYDLQDYNVDAMNADKMDERDRARSVNDQNVDSWNDTQYHNKITAPQSAWDDWMDYGGAITGVQQRQGAYARGTADRLDQERRDRAQAITQTGTNIATWGAGQGGSGNSGNSGTSYTGGGGSRPELADPWDNSWDDDDKDD